MRLQRYIILFLMVVIFAITEVVAQNFVPVKDIDGLKKNLKSSSDAIHSIECDFKQTKVLSILEDNAISTGKFYYKDGNKVRWEIINPDPYLVIINGYKMSIQDKKKTRTYDTKMNKMFGKFNQVMMSTIKGGFGEDNPDYIEEYFQSNKHYQLRLFPKDKATLKYLTSIEVYFNLTSYDVEMIKMLEPGGDFTEINFFNKKINSSIDESTFQISN